MQQWFAGLGETGLRDCGIEEGRIPLVSDATFIPLWIADSDICRKRDGVGMGIGIVMGLGWECDGSAMGVQWECDGIWMG